jgi:hypothetical protein
MENEDFKLQESTNLGLKHVVRRHIDDDMIFLVMQVLLILLQDKDSDVCLKNCLCTM